jgi:hypothetical protein
MKEKKVMSATTADSEPDSKGFVMNDQRNAVGGLGYARKDSPAKLDCPTNDTNSQ